MDANRLYKFTQDALAIRIAASAVQDRATNYNAQSDQYNFFKMEPPVFANEARDRAGHGR